MQTLRAVAVALLVIAVMAVPATEIDVTRLGGDFSSDLPGRHAIQVVGPNIPEGSRRNDQLEGFPVFHRVVTSAQGLGPRFNNDTCSGCHVENGKGPVRISRNPLSRSSMVIKVALRQNNPDGTPAEVPGVGTQIQDHSIDGKSDFPIWLSWKNTVGKYPDGTPYRLRSPELRFRVPGYNQTRLRHTLLMTPPVIGPGLLEAVPDLTILALSDPRDANRDGISGRVNWVTDRRTGLPAIGRFGFKAGQPDVAHISSSALLKDMGISTRLFPDESGVPEISDSDLHLMLVYQNFAGVPFARNQNDPTVRRGKFLFQSIGCNSCHVMTLPTGDTGDERANQTIHPFTNLLIHDMGPGLASTRGEGQATGREWRTTPLWGLGFASAISDTPIRFLHDGRARTLEEAILWHGGEGESSKEKFKNLNKEDRKALVVFLKSL